MKKRILALLLAMSMVFSVTACGKNGDTSTPDKSATSSTTPEKPSDFATAEEAEAAAKATYDELMKAPEADRAALFEKLQAERNYDGNTKPFYVTPESSLVEGFSETVLALKEGEIGMSGKTSYGYFVVTRLPIDEENLTGIRETYVNESFTAELNAKVETANVTTADALTNLDFDAYFAKLAELQKLVNDTYDEAMGDEESDTEPTDEEKAAAEAAVMAAIPDAAKADCTAYLTEGKLTADTVVMTVDGLEIPASVYLYFLGYYKTYYENMMAYYGQELKLSDALPANGDAEPEKNEDGSTKTFKDFFVELAGNYCKQYATAQNLATAAGIKLNAEQEKSIEDALNNITESNILYLGCTAEHMRTIMTFSAYGDAYADKTYGKGGAKEITDEALQEYMNENTYYNCRYILFHVTEQAADSSAK